MKYLIFISLFMNLLFGFDFQIKPIKINENSYFVYGKEEYFSQQNGGDIANCAFIITNKSRI